VYTTSVFVCACVCIFVFLLSNETRENLHTCIHTYTHTYIHTYIRGQVGEKGNYVFLLSNETRENLHTCMHTYIHTYIRGQVGEKGNYVFLLSNETRENLLKWLGDMSNLEKIGLAAEDGYVCVRMFVLCVCMYVWRSWALRLKMGMCVYACLCCVYVCMYGVEPCG
jgi:hypothetical protein